MPLSAPVPRQLLHRRIVQCTGYRREDGLWDIEGQLVDTKAYSFPNEDRGGVIQAGDSSWTSRAMAAISRALSASAEKNCAAMMV